MSAIQFAAKALGGEVYGSNSVLCPGPGHSPRDRSLKVTFHGDGEFICHSFAGDGWRDCRDYVKRMLGADHHRARPERFSAVHRIGKGRADADKTALALNIWDAADRPGRIVNNYFKSRGLYLPQCLAEGDAIRFHGSCPTRLEDGSTVALPAMVALFRDVRTDEPKAIHRTFLEPDGSGKSRRFSDPGNARKMLGPAGGCAIKLTQDSEVTQGLAIAEGIENAVTALFGGLSPVWALGSAGAIKAFPVLSGIECLTILADHDKTGLGAARDCARAWARAGCEAVVTYPPQLGADWNDQVRAAS
jgi:putative DNA primase/helicase